MRATTHDPAGIAVAIVTAVKRLRSIIEEIFDYRTEELFLQILAAILNFSEACLLSRASDFARCMSCGYKLRASAD